MFRFFAALCVWLVISAAGFPTAALVIGTAMFFILGK